MLYDQVQEAVAAIQKRVTLKPVLGLILGSGLGDLVQNLQEAEVIAYEEIPHFLRSTVPGHAGRLLVGRLGGLPVVAMQGRFHLYEGYSVEAITLPVRVMAGLGAQTLVVTNAAGGLHPAYRPGDLMLINDHINLPGLAGANPLVGANEARFGERFPALAQAYDVELRNRAHQVATHWSELTVHEGVYVMVSGPSFETGAELRYLRLIGGDAVGMSTAPEVIVARHMGMKVLGISLITNAATGAETEVVNHAEVLATAEKVRTHFSGFMAEVVRSLVDQVVE